MAFETTLLIVAVIVLVIIVIGFILIYNGLIQLRNRIDNAWSQIDVQLKKRYDLIPNLVNTVKGYAKHEKGTFEKITEARARMASAGTVSEKASATNMLTGALKSLFAVAENYPDLKANQNFLMLQEELSGVENKVAFARQFYNDTVLKYNNQIQTIPSNIVAGMLGFMKRDYFQVEEMEREAVKVEF